jgi:hypothetical protein
MKRETNKLKDLYMKRETKKWTLGRCLISIMNKSNRFNEKISFALSKRISSWTKQIKNRIEAEND